MTNNPVKESTIFSLFLKEKRRELKITQTELAQRAGVGLRFIRDVEQGKKTIRLDTVNQVLALFGSQAGPVRIVKDQ
jgi:y4mF family transcriptional regulator